MRFSILVSVMLLSVGLLACPADTDDTPSSTTDFTKADLEFTTGDEAYLLGVFSLPDGAAAADDNAEFTLSVGGSAASALRLGSRRPSGFDESAWADRMAFDAQRRAGIDRLVTDIRAGLRTLRPGTTRQVETCESGCQGTSMCWKGSCTETPELTFTDGSTVSTTVVAVTTGTFKVNVLLDDDDAGLSASAIAAGESFAAAAGKALGFLGQTSHKGALDRDSDTRMTIVFSSKLETVGSGIVGFFDFKDFLPATDRDATGNEADLLWVRVPGTSTRANCQSGGGCDSDVITPEVAVGTLAHEYTHLVNFAVKVYGRGANPGDNEVLWLDEGMAHLMEDLTGYGASNIGAAAVAFSEWPSATFASPNDSVAQRGQAYLLLRHIIDTRGKAAGAGNAASAASGFALHAALLDETALGFQHSIFSELGADGVWQWLVANWVSNNSTVTEAAAKAYDFLPLSTDVATGQPVGFDPFGTFIDARGTEITLDGPKLGDGSIEELSFTEPYTNTQAVSGSYLFLVTGLATGTTTVTITSPTAVKFKLQAVRVR